MVLKKLDKYLYQHTINKACIILSVAENFMCRSTFMLSIIRKRRLKQKLCDFEETSFFHCLSCGIHLISFCFEIR